jgi:hypothetical protein
MKNIQPIQTWKNGESKTASVLDAYIINDNLSSSCTFYWMLKEADVVSEEQTISGQVLADGNFTLSGDDYINWDDSNEQAFQLIADHLNLELV